MHSLKLSLCMIVRNEEKNLRRCLLSVAEIVDEIVIVDTGSSDKTIEIALEFGAKIFPCEWKGDFAAARNKGIDEASGEWVLVLDADEEVAPQSLPEIRRLLQDHSAAGFFLEFINYYGIFQPDAYFKDSCCRMFRRDERVRFQGRIHEEVASSISALGRAIKHSEVKVLHYGYLDTAPAAKSQRNIDIIEKELKDNPQNIRMQYALAVEKLQLEEYEESLDILTELLERIPLDSNYRPDILVKTIQLLRFFTQQNKALELINENLEHYPDYPDLYDMKAEILRTNQENEKAREALLKARSCPQNHPYSSQAGAGTFSTAFQLGKLEEHLQNYDKAVEHYHAALQYHPNYLPAWKRWVLWHVMNGNFKLLID